MDANRKRPDLLPRFTLVPANLCGFRDTPDGGWKPQTYYAVQLSCFSSNPVFDCLFYTGFLDKDGRPTNGRFIANGYHADDVNFRKLNYLRVINEVWSEK